MVANDEEAKQGSGHQTMTCSGKRADTIYAAWTHPTLLWKHHTSPLYSARSQLVSMILWGVSVCHIWSQPSIETMTSDYTTCCQFSKIQIQLKYCIQLHGINKGILGSHICCHISMQLKRNSELSSIEWGRNLSHLSILIKHFRLWWVIMQSGNSWYTIEQEGVKWCQNFRNRISHLFWHQLTYAI